MTQEWIDYLKALAQYQVDLIEWLNANGGGAHADSVGGPAPTPPPPRP